VGPYIPYDLLQTKGETSAKFNGDRFRNVDFYRVQTQEADKKEQKAISALYIYKKILYNTTGMSDPKDFDTVSVALLLLVYLLFLLST